MSGFILLFHEAVRARKHTLTRACKNPFAAWLTEWSVDVNVLSNGTLGAQVLLVPSAFTRMVYGITGAAVLFLSRTLHWDFDSGSPLLGVLWSPLLRVPWSPLLGVLCSPLLGVLCSPLLGVLCGRILAAYGEAHWEVLRRAMAIECQVGVCAGCPGM